MLVNSSVVIHFIFLGGGPKGINDTEIPVSARGEQDDKLLSLWNSVKRMG